MTTLRKTIIVFYLIVVTVLIAVPLLDGLGCITLKVGTSWLIAQIVVATAVPVAIAVLRTTDFFRDDLNDVAALKRRHADEISKHAAEQLSLSKAYEERIEKLTDEKRQLELRLKPKPPRPPLDQLGA